MAASVGQEEQTRTFIRIWGQGWLQYPGNYMADKLMKDTATARYLLSGMQWFPQHGLYRRNAQARGQYWLVARYGR